MAVGQKLQPGNVCATSEPQGQKPQLVSRGDLAFPGGDRLGFPWEVSLPGLLASLSEGQVREERQAMLMWKMCSGEWPQLTQKDIKT